MNAIKIFSDKLAMLGYPFRPEDITILKGLDDSYRAVIDIVQARDSLITFDALYEKCLVCENTI